MTAIIDFLVGAAIVAFLLLMILLMAFVAFLAILSAVRELLDD